MWFVSKCEHLTVTSTVTIGSEMIGGTIRIEGEDATYLFLTVAVGSKEVTRKTTFDDLYLSAQNLYHGEKGLYPVIDARTDNEHLSTFRQCLFQLTDYFWPQQMTMVAGEVLAKGVEGFDGHPLEEMSKHFLLGFPV